MERHGDCLFCLPSGDWEILKDTTLTTASQLPAVDKKKRRMVNDGSPPEKRRLNSLLCTLSTLPSQRFAQERLQYERRGWWS